MDRSEIRDADPEPCDVEQRLDVAGVWQVGGKVDAASQDGDEADGGAHLGSP